MRRWLLREERLRKRRDGNVCGQSQGGAAGRGHRRRGRHHGLMSEINVTPLVDVMLVLLIIFMVAAPLLTVGVPIDLPRRRPRR